MSVHVEWGGGAMPDWAASMLRSAAPDESTPQDTLTGVQQIKDQLRRLEALFMGQFEDLKTKTADVSREAGEIATAVTALKDRIAALPSTPPDIAAELDALAASAAALDASTTELDTLAVATPPPVEPPAEPPTP